VRTSSGVGGKGGGGSGLNPTGDGWRSRPDSWIVGGLGLDIDGFSGGFMSGGVTLTENSVSNVSNGDPKILERVGIGRLGLEAFDESPMSISCSANGL
jgi:hypothetical protein